jgi:Cys-rich four helix bundle protein (predicted Tat secretion target)
MLDRRHFIVGAVSSLVWARGALAAAGEKMAHKPSPAALENAKNRELASTAAECLKVGSACRQHCVEALANGDESMAKCASTVAAMMPMCSALQELAIQGSPHLAEFARTCGKVCRDCEAACKVHAGHHQICKECMEACQRCAAACEKYSA